MLDNAWDADRQTFTSVIGDEASDVDSALLLLPELGFIEAKDERFIKTVEVKFNLKLSVFQR